MPLLPSSLATFALACWLASALSASSYELRVTQGVLAPDCVSRPVILVNGQFQPTLRVKQGDGLSVTVYNDLPANSTVLSEGISVHWHGFHMKARQWYDGAAFVAHCPIRPGTSFTYNFTVDEPAGTYWWHDHSAGYRFDGLLGPLIVEPADNKTEAQLYGYDEELPPLLLQDWWPVTGNNQLLGLNRPFDADKSTATSGMWKWIGNPPSMLLNGKGMTQDCVSTGTAPNITINCNVTSIGTGPTCSHEVITVESGKSYRLRLISAASLVSVTVCFEGHTVSIIHADARPVKPLQTSCFDMNAGQRVDVVLTANKPAGNYWISIQPQFRLGSGMGYGILRYKTAPLALPTTPLPQANASLPWTADDYAQLEFKPSSNSSYPGYEKAPATADRVVLLNISQPLLQQTGQLRWALNNVVEVRTPPCQPLLKLAKENVGWANQFAAPPPGNGGSASSPLAGVLTGSGPPVVYLEDSSKATLSYPAPGVHVVQLKQGEVIDFVIQNQNANALNGDYRPVGWNRTAMEQHPFHLHGYHFWVIGHGTGNWSSTDSAGYNLATPQLRDTATVFKDGWVAVRINASNPGIWLLHCHILAHEFMGQSLVLVVAADTVPASPPDLPECSKTCTYNLANPGNGTAAGLTPAANASSPPMLKAKGSAGRREMGAVGLLGWALGLGLLWIMD